MKNIFEKIIDIFEARTIGDLGISFDDFKKFIDDWILSEDEYGWNNKSEEKMKSYNVLANILRSKVRNYETVIHSLYIYVLAVVSKLNECKVYNITDEILMLIYNIISKMPASKIEDALAMGMEGIVVDRGDKVVKCFFDDRMPKSKERFYKVCKERKYEVFPYVERIGKGYVIMEKLKMYTPKCDRYQYVIDKVYNDVYDGHYDIDDFSKEEQEVIRWMEDVKTALKDVTNFNDLGDLDEKNFGEREDGTIVYFDI